MLLFLNLISCFAHITVKLVHKSNKLSLYSGILNDSSIIANKVTAT